MPFSLSFPKMSHGRIFGPRYLFQIILLIHSVISCSKPAFGQPKKSPPNIIIFMADDLGWDDVGFHGSPQMKTPNIDALAADSIVLDHLYVSPACTPSRGALLSAVHPIHSSNQNWVIMTAEPRGLPLDIDILPNNLSPFNYKSHLVGKWHLGFHQSNYTPTFRGFDSHLGYWSGAIDYYDHTALEDTTNWGIDLHEGTKLATNYTGKYTTDLFTDRAIEVIHSHDKSRPLFLMLGYQSVHGANHYSRLQAPRSLIDKFEHIVDPRRRTFAAMAYSMDLSIGKVFDTLAQNSMLDNSIVLFMSDNGGPASGFEGNVASNWPLRGTKASLWEGGIRVPAFIWSPLFKSKPRVADQIMHVTDILPTLLSAVTDDHKDIIGRGVNGRPIYGTSFWKSISEGENFPRNELLHNIDPVWNVSAIRVGDFKLVQGLVFSKWSGWLEPLTDPRIDNNIQSNNTEKEEFKAKNSKVQQVLKSMKRGHFFPSNQNSRFISTDLNCGTKPDYTKHPELECKPNIAHCLFNVRSDPCEFENVASKFPFLVTQLWQRILEWNATAAPVGRLPLDTSGSWPPSHEYSWTSWKDL